MMNKNRTYKIAYLGLLIAVALILSYVEVLIPINFGIPGIKLGAANIAAIVTLYLIGYKEAFLVQILRIVLSGFLFGNMYSMLYSLVGGLISLTMMVLINRIEKFSITGVSIIGGVFHNIGQLLVAIFVVSQIRLSFYGPILIVSGVVMGLIIGLICIPTINILKHTFDSDKI